jgi:hypothetical protein
MKKCFRAKDKQQSSLLHYIYPETEPLFKEYLLPDERIDKSKPEYATITIMDQRGIRTYRKRIN